MPRSTSDFRINTAARAYRAAVKAGMRNPQIEISLPNGTTIKVSEQPEAPPAAAGDELDRWMESHAG